VGSVEYLLFIAQNLIIFTQTVSQGMAVVGFMKIFRMDLLQN